MQLLSRLRYLLIISISRPHLKKTTIIMMMMEVGRRGGIDWSPATKPALLLLLMMLLLKALLSLGLLALPLRNKVDRMRNDFLGPLLTFHFRWYTSRLLLILYIIRRGKGLHVLHPPCTTSKTLKRSDFVPPYNGSLRLRLCVLPVLFLRPGGSNLSPQQVLRAR